MGSSRWKEESARHMWGRKCARDSRICRYCHPEVELCDLDKAEYMRHRARAEDIPATIIALLAVESRYRNKLAQEHLTQLERMARGGKLRRAIRSRLEKRQRSLLANDGSQTPYVKHAVDVAMHATATCCRGCIERWHGGALPNECFIRSSDNDLSDAALTYLEAVVHSYLTDFILPAGPVRDFMTELPHKPGERFYEPGEYRIDGTPGQWRVKKVGEGYQGPRTPLKRRVHAKARGESRNPVRGARPQGTRHVVGQSPM